MSRNVVLWSKSNCVQCNQAKRYLARQDVSYTLEDLEANPEQTQAFVDGGAMGAPVLVVDGIVEAWGFNAPRYKELFG